MLAAAQKGKYLGGLRTHIYIYIYNMYIHITYIHVCNHFWSVPGVYDLFDKPRYNAWPAAKAVVQEAKFLGEEHVQN